MQIRSWLLAVVLPFGGCAFTNPANTPLLTSLSAHLDDEEHSASRTLALLVLGTPTCLVDIVVVHPILVIDDCLRESVDLVRDLWKNPNGGITAKAFLFVPKLVLTPVVGVGNFALSWFTRSCFDMREYPSQSPEAEPIASIVEVR